AAPRWPTACNDATGWRHASLGNRRPRLCGKTDPAVDGTMAVPAAFLARPRLPSTSCDDCPMTTPSRSHLANAIRFLAADAVQAANSGHPGMPMGMADIAEVLWRDFLSH